MTTSVVLPIAAPPRSRRGSSSARAALTASVLGFFVVTLDTTVVNVALPTIRTDLGGGLTGLIFVLNLPVGVVTLFLLARAPRSPHHAHPLDRTGQLTGIVAMGGLTYGAIEAGTAGPTAPRVLAALLLAVLAGVAFVVVQARGAHPMLPLDLFRSRTVDVAVAVGFAQA